MGSATDTQEPRPVSPLRAALPPLSGFRPDVQALRGLAVLLVVCFHAEFLVPGGYVGVDVFFVISGFVIGRRLVARASASAGERGEKRSTLVEFYVHRARRILPALAVMLVVVVVVSPFLAPIGGLAEVSPTALAAALFSANLRLYRAATTGYFGPAAELNPLLHTWSLSVEEQFYFVIPVLVLVAWWVGLRRSRSLTTTRLLIVAMTVVSFALCVYLTASTKAVVWHLAPRRFAFYSPVTRAWEFGVGLLLVVLPARWTPTARWRWPLLAVGLAAILAASFGFSDTTAFPGSWALVPVLGTAAVIWAGTRRTPDAAAASEVTPSWLRPATWLGDLSYSWYLWHWPVIVFAVGFWPGSGTALVVAAALSLLPAWGSYRALERPLRATASTRTRPTLALTAVCILAPVLAIGVAKPIRAYANRQGADQFAALVTGATGQRADRSDCLSLTGLDRRPAGACTLGTGPRSVALVGDSNATMFGNAVSGAADAVGTSVQVAAAPGCIFADLRYELPWAVENGADPETCRQFALGTVAALEADPPAVVIVAASVDQDVYINPLPFQGPDGRYTADVDDKARIFVDGLASFVERMQDAGSTVVLIDVVPKPYELDPRECSNLAVIVDAQRCLPGPFTVESRVEMARSNRLVAQIADRTGATVWNFTDDICPDGTCVARRDGFQVWRDPVHISAEQSSALVPKTTGLLRDALSSSGAVAATRTAAKVPASARAYCAVEDRIGALDVLASTRPARVRADLTKLLALTTRAARVAPPEIHADAWAAVDAQRRFNDLYARHGWRPTPTNLDPDFVALADDPALGGVYQRLEQFQGRVCDRRDANPYVA